MIIFNVYLAGENVNKTTPTKTYAEHYSNSHFRSQMIYAQHMIATNCTKLCPSDIRSHLILNSPQKWDSARVSSSTRVYYL